MRNITFHILVSSLVAISISLPAFAADQKSQNNSKKTQEDANKRSKTKSENLSKGKKAEIDKLVKELGIMVGKKPVETLQTVKLRIKLAHAYANNQQFKDAAQQLVMVRDYYKLTGKGSFDERLNVLGRLVDNYNFMGNGAESLPLAVRYFDKVEDLSQATHTDKLAGYWRLAFAYNLTKEFDKAQENIDAGRKMVKIHFNSRSPMDGLLLQEQLKINLSKKEKKKARKTESDIMKNIDSTVTKNSNLGVFMMFQLAKVYSRYGDIDNAKRVLEKALHQPVLKSGEFNSLKANLEKELEKISHK